MDGCYVCVYMRWHGDVHISKVRTRTQVGRLCRLNTIQGAQSVVVNQLLKHIISSLMYWKPSATEVHK